MLPQTLPLNGTFLSYMVIYKYNLSKCNLTTHLMSLKLYELDFFSPKCKLRMKSPGEGKNPLFIQSCDHCINYHQMSMKNFMSKYSLDIFKISNFDDLLCYGENPTKS